jgi:hypothetical protein
MEFSLIAIALLVLTREADTDAGKALLILFAIPFLCMAAWVAPYGEVF